jgi:hypothetical protein
MSDCLWGVLDGMTGCEIEAAIKAAFRVARAWIVADEDAKTN